MAIFKIEKTKDFVVMSNYHLRDTRLTLKAKGLLSQMLSLPVEWDFSMKGLAQLSLDGIDSVRAGIQELEQAGYVVRNRVRDEQGRLRGTEYSVYEIPQLNPTNDDPEGSDRKPKLGDKYKNRKKEDLLREINDILDENYPVDAFSDASPLTNDVPALVSPKLENPTLENPTQKNIYEIKYINNIKEKRNKKKEKFEPAQSAEKIKQVNTAVEPIPPQAISAEWEAFKTAEEEKGRPVTPTRAMAILKRLEEYAPGDVKQQKYILEENTVNDWKRFRKPYSEVKPNEPRPLPPDDIRKATSFDIELVKEKSRDRTRDIGNMKNKKRKRRA